MKKNSFVIFLACLLVIAVSGTAFGWSCKTHKFIALRADLSDVLDSVCCPDTCNDENHDAIYPLHFYDAAPDTRVSPEYLDNTVEMLFIILYPYLPEPGQIKIKVPNKSGALYWEILELYKDMQQKKKDGDKVYYSTIAHFVGDLSQPLHNFPYENKPASDGKTYDKQGYWAKSVHSEFDKAFDKFLTSDCDETVLLNMTDEKMAVFLRTSPTREMKSVDSVDDLKKRISEVANSSIRIANDCYARYSADPDNPDSGKMTEAQLFKQIKLSISLSRAIKEGIENAQ